MPEQTEPPGDIATITTVELVSLVIVVLLEALAANGTRSVVVDKRMFASLSS
jgi:hypothetical protein